jgi:hypothetical protein
VEPEKDFWFYLAVGVSTVAIFVLALGIVTKIGGWWLPWAALAVVVLAGGGVSIRAGLKVRKVARPPLSTAERNRRTRKQLLELMPTMMFASGNLVMLELSRQDMLPQWLGCLMYPALIAMWIWMGRLVRRISE